jgi:hypothetical protein
MLFCLSLTSLVVAPLRADGDKDGGGGVDPQAYYRWYFDQRNYQPIILVTNGGLAGGSYYPWSFFDSLPEEVQYYCSIAFDSAYLTDPVTGLSAGIFGGLTPGLYQRLLNDNIDLASWIRNQFSNGLLISNSGFGVTPYALGQSAYNELISLMDSLVNDPNAVFDLNPTDNDMLRRYGYSYAYGTAPEQVRYYKRTFSLTGGYIYEIFNNVCDDVWLYYEYTSVTVYYLAAADGSDANYRWNSYYYPAIYNFLRYGLPRYYPQWFQHPASSVVKLHPWCAFCYRATRTVELVLIPSVPFEIEQYLEQCSLCDLINGINSLIQAYNWDSNADHWRRVRDMRVFYPNYTSWKEFISNLLQAVRPVYQPCPKGNGSFIVTASIPVRYPPDALEQGIGLTGELIHQAIQDGRYIPVFHTRSAWNGQGEEHFVFLDTCSPGMLYFSYSTRFASYVLFTIWFAFALRRAIMQAFDLVRGDGGNE